MPASIRLLLAAGFAAMAGAAVAADDGYDSYFGWLSVGTTFTLEENHLFWVGQFSGNTTDNKPSTILDKAGIQCPGYLDISLATGTAKGAGACIWTTVTGDKMFGTWTCEGGAPMSGKACAGQTTVTGGTGKLAGASGGNTFDAFTVAFFPDGNGSGYTLTHNSFKLPN